MHIKYHPDIDALYIGLNERVKSKTRQITDSIVLDFDVDDKLIGIEILAASESVADPVAIAHEILSEASRTPRPRSHSCRTACN
ncbi:MAG: DUF2283 domain-containing protein, partial [Anaerolineae bacterium]|nr:DUF2283 domain-containing protein [Anaerolineae bacterium]